MRRNDLRYLSLLLLSVRGQLVKLHSTTHYSAEWGRLNLLPDPPDTHKPSWRTIRYECVEASVLSLIVAERGKPQTIKSDNGSEFISKVMDKWAYERGVKLDFSRPGKPTDNAMVESFACEWIMRVLL